MDRQPEPILPRLHTDEGGSQAATNLNLIRKTLRSVFQSYPRMTRGLAWSRRKAGQDVGSGQAITCPTGDWRGDSAAPVLSPGFSFCVWFPDTVSSFKISNCLLV